MPFAPIPTHSDKIYERILSERYAAGTQSLPSPNSRLAERPHSSYYRPNEGDSSGRLSPPPTWQNRSDGRRADSNRHINVDSYRPTPTLSTLSPVTVPSFPNVSNHLSLRSREAERERASTRADSRRLQEQQDAIDNLQARLQLEIRAKAIADEHAKIAYDLGVRHGMQIMETQVLARASALPYGIMPYPMPSSVQSLPVPFQGPQADYTNSQTPPISHEMPQSLGNASEASRKPSSASTRPHLMSPPASSQYGGPAMLPGSLDRPQPVSTDAAASPPVEVSPGARVDFADVRISELREKAMAATAAFRDRQAAQQWLNQNSHLVEGHDSAVSAEAAGSGKRKRTAAGGDAQ